MNTLSKVFLSISIIFATAAAGAATHEVKMLNNGKDGIMVFEPAFLKAAKGDTVKFVPTDPAHDVSSVVVPKGQKPWTGEVNKAVTVKLTEDGVYLYECKAHISMAMVGVIQVGGKAQNMADVEKGAKELTPKFVLNKDRLTKILAQVQK